MLQKQNIKIAHLIGGKFVGGIERDFSEFINYSYKNVHHFVITKNRLHPLISKNILNTVENIFSMNYLGNIKIPKLISILKSKFIGYKIKFIGPPDIWLLWSIFPNYLLSLTQNSKMIYYDHGKAWYKKGFNSKNIKFLNRVDMIICVSNAAKRMLELKWGITNKNVKIIYNALRFTCKPENQTTKSINKNKPLNIGIAGRHISFKGFSLMLYTVSELKKRKVPCKLFIAGVGNTTDDLMRLVTKLNLEDDVKFLGLVEDMKEFYSQIDLFICPSIREPFGLVNIEAMAHGCPVIVAGVDGMPEILDGANAGFVIKPTLEIEKYPEFGGSLDLLKEVEYVYDPYTDTIIRPRILNPLHIADAIEELWSNPDRFSEMSKNAIQLVNEKFDYEKHVEELYEVITETIKK
jgi:glycosyltransferase involved in cell wall biosynthesis